MFIGNNIPWNLNALRAEIADMGTPPALWRAGGDSRGSFEPSVFLWLLHESEWPLKQNLKSHFGFFINKSDVFMPFKRDSEDQGIPQWTGHCENLDRRVGFQM